MKRICSLVLALALLAVSVSALAVSPAQIVKDVWYLNSMDGRGLSAGSELSFNRDKSITLVLNGESQDTTGCTWSISNDNITVLKDSSYWMSLDYANDTLTVSTDKFSSISGNAFYHEYVFSHQPSSFYTPSAKAAEQEDDFYGSYVPSMVLVNNTFTDEFNGLLGMTIDFAEVTIYRTDVDPTVFMTLYDDGKLFVSESSFSATIELTDDPEILLVNDKDRNGETQYIIYMKKGEIVPNEAAEPTAEPEPAVDPAQTEEPERSEVPEQPETEPAVEPDPQETTGVEQPAFPPVLDPTMPVIPEAASNVLDADDPAAAFFGTYKVYQDVLQNGRVLDMTEYDITATIGNGQVEAVAYGRTVTVPYTYGSDGFLRADISALYPDFGFATALLVDNELLVNLADAEGNIGETLYLAKID